MGNSLAIAAVFVALTLQACGPSGDDEAQFRIALREISADMAATNVADSSALPPIAPDSAATGRAGAFSRAFKTFLIRALADRRALGAEMDAVHFQEATTPEALAETGGVGRARAALAASKAVLTKYRALNARNLADVRREMSVAAPGSSAVTAFQRGFDSSMADGGPASRLFDLNLRISDEYGRLLDDLEHSNGRWRVSDSHFIFADDRDLVALNDHMRMIRELGAQEQGLVTSARQETTQSVHAVDEATKP